MRQATWIAFLLLTVGLLSYEAALDPAADSATSQSVAKQDGGISPDNPEGMGDLPPKP